jgi:hypothetical protein
LLYRAGSVEMAGRRAIRQAIFHQAIEGYPKRGAFDAVVFLFLPGVWLLQRPL